MSDESIEQLAERVGTPIDRFLLQIEEAGLPQRKPGDSIKKGEIEKLLAHLKAVSYTHLTLPTICSV